MVKIENRCHMNYYTKVNGAMHKYAQLTVTTFILITLKKVYGKANYDSKNICFSPVFFSQISIGKYKSNLHTNSFEIFWVNNNITVLTL